MDPKRDDFNNQKIKNQLEWEARLKEREEKQKKWLERVNKSNNHSDYILRLTNAAEPASESALGNLILTIATGGLYAVLESLKSPKEIFEEKKSYLRSCSTKLNEARDYFQSHKNDMIGEDIARASAAIYSVNNKLKAAWAEINNQQQKAWEFYKQAKQEQAKERAAQKAAWEERQRINAEKQKLYEEKKQAWEERQRIKAERQKEWESRQAEKERKQREWEERQRERERKKSEWEERQREREKRQQEWEERQRSRENRKRY